jgi:putative ABC transport system permease protein
VLLASHQLDRAFERDLEGIDLVVGAKGSPLQLILAGVFHIDVPTGNIPLQEVQALQKNPLVAQVIPLSLGDSYQGFRIVGTTPDYVAHYQATLAEGALWQQPMDAVLGASVARGIVKAGHAAALVGATFIGSHGLGGGGMRMATTPTASAACWRPAAACSTGSSSPAPNRSGRCTRPPRPTTPKTWKP